MAPGACAGADAGLAIGAVFRAAGLRRGAALREALFRAGRDFLAAFRRAPFRFAAFILERLRAAGLRRDALRFAFFLATVLPPWVPHAPRCFNGPTGLSRTAGEYITSLPL